MSKVGAEASISNDSNKSNENDYIRVMGDEGKFDP